MKKAEKKRVPSVVIDRPITLAELHAECSRLQPTGGGIRLRFPLADVPDSEEAVHCLVYMWWRYGVSVRECMYPGAVSQSRQRPLL